MQGSAFYGDLRDASFRIAFPLNKESDESVLFESDVGSDAPAVTLGVPEYVTDTAWIVPVSDDAEKASALDGISGISDLVSAAFLNGLTPKKGEIRVLVSGKKGTVVLCGTGKEGELDQETLAALSSAAGKAVSAAGAVDIVNALPAVPCGELVNDERVRLSTEALIEGSYFSSSWKSAPEKRDFSGTMVYVYPGEESRDLADNCQDGLSGGAELQRRTGVGGTKLPDRNIRDDLDVISVVIPKDFQIIQALPRQTLGTPLTHSATGHGGSVAERGCQRFHISSPANIALEQLIHKDPDVFKRFASLGVFLVIGRRIGDIEGISPAGIVLEVYLVQRK